jgi:hypothetical protein
MLAVQGGALAANLALRRGQLQSSFGPALALNLTGGSLQRSVDRSVRLELAGTVAGAGTPALLAPMPFTLTGQGAAGAPVMLAGTATAAGKAATVKLAGSVDLAGGSGSLRLALPPVTFTDTKPAVAVLSPLLARHFAVDSGRIGLDLQVGWGAATTSGARLLLDQVTGTGHGIAVDRLSGVIVISDLVRLATPPEQKLAMAGLTAGLPLEAGELQFSLAGGRRLTIDRAAWTVAGGRLQADPGVVDLAGDARLVLRAEDIDLQQLLQLAQVEGLQATGRLRGTLPLRLAGDTVTVEDGVLETVGAGQVRYVPAEPPAFLTDTSQGGSAILASALKNFQYKTVTLGLSGVVGGEQKLRLQLQGANPDLYGGYPMALNVNLSGGLDRILSQSMGSWRLPDDIRAKIESFGGEIGQ